MTTSTGFVMNMKRASGATPTRFGTIFFMRLTVDPASSRRDCPGCCLAPAVTMMRSAPRTISTSSEPSTEPQGVNWMPWAMSSASASTLGLLMSWRTIDRASPRIAHA